MTFKPRNRLVIRRLGWALVCAAGLGASPLQADELGGFVPKTAQSGFAQGPGLGDKVLFKANVPLNVMDFKLVGKNEVWLLVADPTRKVLVRGSGWTPMSVVELKERRPPLALVFDRPMEQPTAPFLAQELPAQDLLLEKDTQPSKAFPYITWQKVSYATRLPRQGWIKESAGIYRPGRNATVLAQTLDKLARNQVPPAQQGRLLAGVVRVGDSPREVNLALGQPDGQQETQVEDVHITRWQYPGLNIKFENNVVKQIN